MRTPARALTKKGIAIFRGYLGALRAGEDRSPPRELLLDRDRSEAVEGAGEVRERSFRHRLDAARELHRALEGVAHLADHVGLWTWLSLYYFDQLCPAESDGRRRPRSDYRYIFEPGYPYGHRHLLAGPYFVYRLHGEEARLLLSTKLPVENGFHKELGSRQNLITNRAVIALADKLYLNRRGTGPKRGAQQGRHVPGSLERFIDVVSQLDLNYDLHSMRPEDILELLPEEFDRWKPLRRRAPRPAGKDSRED